MCVSIRLQWAPDRTWRDLWFAAWWRTLTCARMAHKCQFDHWLGPLSFDRISARWYIRMNIWMNIFEHLQRRKRSLKEALKFLESKGLRKRRIRRRRSEESVKSGIINCIHKVHKTVKSVNIDVLAHATGHPISYLSFTYGCSPCSACSCPSSWRWRRLSHLGKR